VLGEGNYRKGEEALINCLLLSRCCALIRTTSFLSAWASIFNPALPIVFAERTIRKKSLVPGKAADSQIASRLWTHEVTMVRGYERIGAAMPLSCPHRIGPHRVRESISEGQELHA
jgi:hypothetical protein